MEYDFFYACFTLGKFFATGSWLYYLFAMQTKAGPTRLERDATRGRFSLSSAKVAPEPESSPSLLVQPTHSAPPSVQQPPEDVSSWQLLANLNRTANLLRGAPVRLAPVLTRDEMLAKLGATSQRLLRAPATEASKRRRTQWDQAAAVSGPEGLRPRVLASGSAPVPEAGPDGGGGARVDVLPLMATASDRAAELIQGTAKRWLRRRGRTPPA